ncbi:hypothetical protein [Amycolatopsis sp. cmx-11-32]|uniref:hypothetical protein n=1 Tax=Amycolatopsis sp. cmx-11-32 TaxID=2785796 RepID=UPI0039E33900
MDGTRTAVPGSAAGVPVLPEGEVWVAMPYKPIFPGILPGNETPPGTVESLDTCPVLHNPDNVYELRLRCRPAVA